MTTCAGGSVDESLPHQTIDRILAQPGSASALGAEGRRFESYMSDQDFSAVYSHGRYVASSVVLVEYRLP